DSPTTGFLPNWLAAEPATLDNRFRGRAWASGKFFRRPCGSRVLARGWKSSGASGVFDGCRHRVILGFPFFRESFHVHESHTHAPLRRHPGGGRPAPGPARGGRPELVFAQALPALVLATHHAGQADPEPVEQRGPAAGLHF